MWSYGDDRSWTTRPPPDGWQRRPSWSVTTDGDRSAALVVRVWREDGVPSFRGRLMSMDTSGGATAATVGLASSPRDVVDAVRAWLEEFVGDAPVPIDADD